MKKWAWIALVTILIDQAAKAYAAIVLRAEGAKVLIPGVLQLRYAENTGMAFSLLSGHGWLLGVLSIALIVLEWLVLRRYRLGTVSHIAAMLMLGGAVGNLLDRLLRGFVVDFLEPLFVSFAVFNLADAALTIGTVLIAVSILFCTEEWRKKDGSP